MVGCPLSEEKPKYRFRLLGHVLRRDQDDPTRAATYDRFGQPKVLGGKARWGACRAAWTEKVQQEAAAEISEQGRLFPGGGPPGNIYRRIAEIAQDRVSWAAWIEDWYKKQGWWSYDTRSSA